MFVSAQFLCSLPICCRVNEISKPGEMGWKPVGAEGDGRGEGRWGDLARDGSWFPKPYVRACGGWGVGECFWLELAQTTSQYVRRSKCCFQ